MTACVSARVSVVASLLGKNKNGFINSAFGRHLIYCSKCDAALQNDFEDSVCIFIVQACSVFCPYNAVLRVW